MLLCGGSALLTLVLALSSVPSWRGSDIPFLLLGRDSVPGAGSAGRRAAGFTAVAWSLFSLTVALALAGVGCFAVDSWIFHTVAEYGLCSASPWSRCRCCSW